MSGVWCEFGQELRSERERRGISLEAMCAETKVNSRHLRALEQGDYMALPGGVFRKGIVRAYLHATGLDEVEWMPRFNDSHASFQKRAGGLVETGDDAWATFALNVKKNRGGMRDGTAMRWLGVLVLLLLLSVAGWAVYHTLLRAHLHG